jgi:hypothetical protein
MASDDTKTEGDASRRALVEVSPDLAARFGDPRLTLALVAGIGGAVALLIGYFGVSGTLDTGKQLPYLISGGIGGLFLLGLAAALLFSADLGATRADIARLHDAVEELSEQVAELRATLGDGAEAEPAPARAGNGRSRRPARGTTTAARRR